MSNPNQGTPAPPNFSKDYEKGIQIAMKYLPQQLQQEFAMRAQYDPAYIQQALGLQHTYDPALAGEQLAALQRRDPQWLALHQGLGDKVQQALDRGYIDPLQNAAYQKWGALAGTIDPLQAAAYRKAGALAGVADPTRAAEYKALGQQVTGDTLRGQTMSPEDLRQRTQAIMAQRPGLSYGEAQDIATASGIGIAGERLQQQRQAAGEQFLGQQSTDQQQQQSANAFYGMPSLVQQQQASLGQFNAALSPEMQTYGLAGTYIQPSNSLTGQINQIQGVTPPSANRYVNPNAGYQGAQYGLQNYQNVLAQNQMSNSSNPWTNALSGAAQGAQVGSAFGGYGALIGGAAGAIGGGFGYSDVRLKNKITRAGTVTADGIPIVEFSYNGSDKRWRGVIAQDVLKVRPDAVHTFPGGTLGVFYSKLGIELEEVN